ncbi:MAG: hypothetical protein HQL08_09180, partial [Nitrospirae bacterium]|nr:hypothetical protein [Nitrospirota bacterium]
GAEAIIGNVDKKEMDRNPRGLYVRAALLSRKGMHREAVAIINKVFDAVLKEEDLRVEKAMIFLNASRSDDAEKLCKSIVANPVSKSEKQRAEKILAGLYERKGKVDEALQLYLDIVPYETEDSVKMSLARLYDKKG